MATVKEKIMFEQKYRCIRDECKAEDTVRLFPNEPAPACIHCWKCHSGFGYKASEMAMEGRGMFPVGKPVHVE